MRALAARGADVAIHCHASRRDAEELAEEVRGGGGDGGGGAGGPARPGGDGAAGAGGGGGAGPAADACWSTTPRSSSTTPSRRATWESWDRHIGSNLRAPFELIQAFAAQAPRAGRDAAGEPLARACVVNMVDQRVLKLTPEFATYTIAKMGLWALTRTAAQGLAPDVRVNAIGPGPTLRGVRQSERHFADQRAATVLGRGASPAEIAAALAFILDAPGLTGQLIAIDGGQHLAWRTADVAGGGVAGTASDCGGRA